MDDNEIFLENTSTSITEQGLEVTNRVSYGDTVPNILQVWLDESGESNTGNGFALFREDKMNVEINDKGELIITSFIDDEANNYSIDEDGNLIYTD